MSSVIVLSDSDEPASPVVKRNGNESEDEEGYRLDAACDFDFPEVPFCRETPGSQTEEDLPDLNVNINDCKLARGSSHTMSDSCDSEDDRAKKTQKASKRNKAASKEEQLRRRQALAREKALKAIERKKSREMKPGECIKFMEVSLDEGIDFALRAEVESALRNADVKFNATTELIPSSITWRRNVEQSYVDEDNEVRVRKSVQAEEYTLVIWSNCEAVRHVAEGTFCASVSSNKALMPSHSLTLIIFGMEEYFAYQKKQKSGQSCGTKGSKCNSRGNHQRFETLPIISRQQLKMCLAEVQIAAKCSSRLVESVQDLALMVYQYTKSISEIPYKLQKRESQENKFDWYVMGDNKNTVRVDKDGNGLKRLWQQQLCQFNLSSLETSEAICAVYPSPAQLIEAYRNCTPDEGINLLKDIPIRRAAGPLTAVRKIGPELSKKIYVMFTARNGDALLGTEV